MQNQIILLQRGKLQISGATDAGCKRDHNEDSLCINNELNFIAVADGMGGHDAGEVASAKAVESLCNYLQRLEDDSDATMPEMELQDATLEIKPDDEDSTIDDIEMPLVQVARDAANYCNKVVHDMNVQRGHKEGVGMGTTLVGCWFQADSEGDKVITSHVGDSRIYRYRDNRLEQLTKDHSMLQFWMNNGCQGERPKSNIILQSIGPSADIEPDASMYFLQEEDIYLLCSDGLNDMITDDEITEIVQQGEYDLSLRCQNLIDLAKEHGGKDNVTVILVQYKCK